MPVRSTLDNELKATSTTTQTMGQELISEMGYYFPQEQQWETTQNLPIAGQYEAIALDLQGISQQQAEKLKADLEITQEKLENQNIADLTKHSVIGDLLYSTAFSYFAWNDAQDPIASNQSGVIHYRAPSHGLFQTSLKAEYWFGTPRSIKVDKLMMDIDRYYMQTIDKNNIEQNRVNYHKFTGFRISAMEHVVPEQMYSTTTNPMHGVSAVKAIQLAAQEGQRIYNITLSNVSTVLNAINLPAAIENEINNAIYAGKIVTTHTAPLNFYGSQSVGYIIIDPVTGGGAYKISGGQNGADVLGPFLTYAGPWLALLSLGLGLAAAAPALALMAPLLVFLSFLLALVLAIDSLIYYLWTSDGECGALPPDLLLMVPLVFIIASIFAEGALLVKFFASGLIVDGALVGACT